MYINWTYPHLHLNIGASFAGSYFGPKAFQSTVGPASSYTALSSMSSSVFTPSSVLAPQSMYSLGGEASSMALTSVVSAFIPTNSTQEKALQEVIAAFKK